MNKDNFIKFRISTERKQFWIGQAKEKELSLSELIHVAMKKECGLSPFDIEEMKK